MASAALYVSATPLHLASLPAITRAAPNGKSPTKLLRSPSPQIDPRSQSVDTGIEELRRRSGRPPVPNRKRIGELSVQEKIRSSVDRKSRFVKVDHEAMRKLAEERAQLAQRAASDKAKQAAEEALKKRQEAAERRARDAEVREQRRAEI